MTAQTRTVLKGKFEQGDTPQGTDYVDLIDSFIVLSDSTAQSLTSPLTMAGSLGVAATVSASDMEVLGIIRVSGAATFDGHVSAASMTVTGDVTADAVYASAATIGSVTTSALAVSGDAVIRGNLEVQGTLEFQQVDVGELYIEATAAVSASATYVEVITVATANSTFLVSFAVTAGSLIYTGTATRSFLGLLSMTIEASGANTETFLTLGVDGSALTRLEVAKSIDAADDEMEMHGMLQLAQNERVSPMIRTDAALASGWSIKRLVMTVKE